MVPSTRHLLSASGHSLWPVARSARLKEAIAVSFLRSTSTFSGLLRSQQNARQYHLGTPIRDNVRHALENSLLEAGFSSKCADVIRFE
jgi:hypothetical protein